MKLLGLLIPSSPIPPSMITSDWAGHAKNQTDPLRIGLIEKARETFADE
jgi:hypothetical protein